MFRHQPLILGLIILFAIFSANIMSPEIKSIFYAISLSIKSIIVFLLPIIIFGLLFKTVFNLSKNATGIIIFVLLALCVSNFTSTMLSYLIGKLIFNFKLAITLPVGAEGLMPYWEFGLPKIISNDKAMFLALVLGVVTSLYKPRIAEKFSFILEKVVNKILESFTYLIPLFILGFIIKMKSDGVINIILKDYALIFGLVIITQISYITLLYLINTKFNLAKFARSIMNMLPAAMLGFSSMSSAAAMPLTIKGVEKNSDHPDLSKSIIPLTVNIHLIGDCFAIPIFAYAVMKNFGQVEPSLYTYIIFTCYFVLAKFSVAGIPGGGIIVMLPVLEKYLGFNAEMLSLITALYILFDPIITCVNVLGNGGFAVLISKLIQNFSRKT